MTGDGGNLADLADFAPVERDALYGGGALGMREDTALRARHGVLADEHDTVVQMVGKIVVGRRRLALNQFRGGFDLVDGERSAAVVSVPDYDLARSPCAGASDGGVDFAGEELARFHVSALPGQQLLFAVVHAAN